MERKRTGKIEHWHIVAALLICYDIVAIAASYFFALLLRFDLHYGYIPKTYFFRFLKSIPFYVVICIIVFLVLHLYASIWRFASYRELRNLIIATIITLVINVAGTSLILGRMPISYYAFGIAGQFILTMGIRFAYRFVLLLKAHGQNNDYKAKVMIIGAGSAGQMLVRDLKASDKTTEKVVCFIDDNSNKWNRYVDGVPVVGGRDSILERVQ
ncbi:MAG: hypothetical protein IKZ95_03695 [Lachnospiraceae bacterium]|nr:hypothetical protein [Lachnospiraceae bacterium]